MHAAQVVRLAVQGWTYLARTALQQPGAEPGFELIEGVGQRGAGQVQVLGGQGEAAALVDPYEDLHRPDLIHLKLLNIDCW
ncbi:hypothetical protein D3C73_1347890 [compost metagenome]